MHSLQTSLSRATAYLWLIIFYKSMINLTNQMESFEFQCFDFILSDFVNFYKSME